MTLQELSNEQLQINYAVALKQYNKAYKTKKELEEEMLRRFNDEAESR